MRIVLAALAAAFASLALAPGAQAEVVWLCEPGMEENPCRDSLETTVYDSEGNSRVENPPLPADPPIDCFYVYPTVSEQQSRNANKDVDPEIRAIAQMQASRFSQVCRVYAPVYRQQTLIGLAQGGSAESYQLAYGDVEEAWREYRARFNGGRGVVLIGHSQGTRMLRRLLRDEIDQRRAERRRLVSALLLGGQVTVRRDQLAGGDFQNVPVCAAHDQTGCVIAWSTFNETPPSNSRYGRPPAEDTSGFGFPTGDEYEIVCTNPASLGANERVPLSTYLRGEPFPGFIGLLLVEMYGGPQPSAETAWLQPQDHYTGRCEERDGANVLMLEPIGNARRLNPSPDPSWGLHLADGNIALGDLVATVNEQSTAFRRKRPRPGAKPPRLSLRVKGRRGPRRCLRGDARVSLHGKGIKRIRDVEFAVGRNVYARDVRAPFRVTVQGGRLAGPAIRRLRAFVHLRGRVNIALVRHVRICR